MNKDFGNMEELEYGVRLTMPLLTQEEINGIYININEITEQFTKMVIKDKDLAIAQYIMDKQQKMLEQKQFILDKVTIYININEITEQFTKMVIKDKDLAIAQYIMDKQQKMLEQKQFILDKVTKTLKRDREIFDKCRKKHEMYSPSEERMNTKYYYTVKAKRRKNEY